MDLIYDMAIVDGSQSVANAVALQSVGVTCQLNRAALATMQVTPANIDGVRLVAQLYQATSPGGVPTLTAVGQPERMVHTGGGTYTVGIPAPTVAGGATFTGIIKVQLGYPIEVPASAGYSKSAISESDAGHKGRPVRFTRAAA